MITQNPIVGRSRKKLSGVYARTLWGQNVIQSCPTPTRRKPTKALKDSRAAFARVMNMANMLSQSWLNQLYYVAPVGRSRRHVLSSQLFTGVVRNDFNISYDLLSIERLGLNAICSTSAKLYTAPTKSFSILASEFQPTQIADTTRKPLVIAISYELSICASLWDCVTVNGNTLDFDNISSSFVGREALYICLWMINVGTSQNPVWVPGSYALQ